MDDHEEENELRLLDADPNCDHEYKQGWSGIKCKKCKGWYCY